MTIVAGVFPSAEVGHRAALAFQRVGFVNVNLLLPGSPESLINAVQISETEQPGMGAALGGVVGGALGIAGGLGLGPAVASLLIPGVGPVLAVGLAAGALFAAGGAIAGAAAGAHLEADSTRGIPVDELYVYKDALRRGKAVLFVQARDEEENARAHMGLSAAGAETIDAAREQHWIGLRSAEKEHYRDLGGDFEKDESEYRRGFEAALKASGDSATRDTTSYAFRQGYQRGMEQREAQERRHKEQSPGT